MSLDSGRKTERSHADPGRTCTGRPQLAGVFEPSRFLQWGNHCVSSVFYSCIYAISLRWLNMNKINFLKHLALSALYHWIQMWKNPTRAVNIFPLWSSHTSHFIALHLVTVTVLWKTLRPPLISLYLASQDSNTLVFFLTFVQYCKSISILRMTRTLYTVTVFLKWALKMCLKRRLVALI